MKTLHRLKISLLYVVLLIGTSFSALPSANVVDLPDFSGPVATSSTMEVLEKAPIDEDIFSYRALMADVYKIRQNPNQIRSEYDLEILAKEVVGKTFLFKDTVMVKRNALVSRDMGFWFEPYPDVDVLLLLKSKNYKEFAGIEEFDFLTAKVTCLELGDVHRFEMISAEDIAPFDAGAKFVDFSKMIKDLDFAREGKTYFEYKAHVEAQVDQFRHQLGHVTGEVIELFRKKNGHFALSMKAGDDHVATVNCHPGFLDVLLNVQPKSKISMAVIFERADLREGFFFNRGCLIRLPE